MATGALERFFEKKQKQEEELNALKQEAQHEISQQINKQKEIIKEAGKEIEELTQQHIELFGVGLDGKPPKKPRKSSGPKAASGRKADVGDEAELEKLLKSTPDHRVNRKGIIVAGYNLPSAISIAKRNPKKFGFKQNKAQGEVFLLK